MPGCRRCDKRTSFQHVLSDDVDAICLTNILLGFLPAEYAALSVGTVRWRYVLPSHFVPYPAALPCYPSSTTFAPSYAIASQTIDRSSRSNIFTTLRLHIALRGGKTNAAFTKYGHLARQESLSSPDDRWIPQERYESRYRTNDLQSSPRPHQFLAHVCLVF